MEEETKRPTVDVDNIDLQNAGSDEPSRIPDVLSLLSCRRMNPAELICLRVLLHTNPSTISSDSTNGAAHSLSSSPTPHCTPYQGAADSLKH